MRTDGSGHVPRHQQRRVAIVEDHRLQRLRTEELISAQAGMRVVASFETFPDFMAWVKQSDARQRPHLLVLDLMVERGPSVDPTMVKRLVDAGMRILVLSALASPSLVREVLRAGVGGFVGKRDSESDITISFNSIPVRGSIAPCLIIDITTTLAVDEASASYRRLRDYVLEKYGELSTSLPQGVVDALDGSFGPILRVNHESTP